MLYCYTYAADALKCTIYPSISIQAVYVHESRLNEWILFVVARCRKSPPAEELHNYKSTNFAAVEGEEEAKECKIGLFNI